MTRHLATLRGLSNHPFKIETGRYHKPKIERSNRVCWLCAPNFLPSLPVEDEHHIIYECNFFTSLRNKFLKPETDQITIENLFNSPPQFINRLSRFINACIVERAEYRKLFWFMHNALHSYYLCCMYLCTYVHYAVCIYVCMLIHVPCLYVHAITRKGIKQYIFYLIWFSSSLMEINKMLDNKH